MKLPKFRRWKNGNGFGIKTASGNAISYDATSHLAEPDKLGAVMEMVRRLNREPSAAAARIRREMIEECAEEVADTLRVARTDGERDLLSGCINRIRALADLEEGEL